MKRNWVIIPAAGIGVRFGANLPKQYQLLTNESILENTAATLSKIFNPHRILIAISATDTHFSDLTKLPDNTQSVVGGATRQQSVQNALEEIKEEIEADDWVVVHDAVRPILNWLDSIALEKIWHHPIGGHFAITCSDAPKIIDETGAIQSLSKKNLLLSQTPQLFRFAPLYESLKQAEANNLTFDDETSAIVANHQKTIVAQGSRSNIKITYPEDLSLARAYL